MMPIINIKLDFYCEVFQMIDFSKTYCNLHPHELITNFCVKQECLIGLCANCVCTHTQSHVEKGTSPEYENIRTTYKTIQDRIRNQVDAFDDDKNRIGKLGSKIEQKRSKAKQIVQLAKEQTFGLLSKYFEDRERALLIEIEAQQKRSGLHCYSRLESLNNLISRQVSTLVSAAQDITSNNFLESLPRIRTQTLVNANNLHQEVTRQLQDNENYNTTITYNRSILNALPEMLEKSIKITFSLDHKSASHPLARPSSQNKNVSSPKFSPVFNLGSVSPIDGLKNGRSQITINQNKLSCEQMSQRQANNKSSYLNDFIYPNDTSMANERNKNIGSCVVQANNYSTLEPISDNFSHLRTEEKFSIAKLNSAKPVTFDKTSHSYETEAMKYKKCVLNKRSKKSGLRVMANCDTESEYSKQVNENHRSPMYRTHFL